MTSKADQQDLENEIADLEIRLEHAKNRLDEFPGKTSKIAIGLPHVPSIDSQRHQHAPSSLTPGFPPTAHHSLILLSDSALPLGSFAFSSGLESYLAHHRNAPTVSSTSPIASFRRFLTLTLASLSSTTGPYILAAYRQPSRLADLDNDLDASTPCTVARRASVAQGKALLSVWQRCLQSARPEVKTSSAAVTALEVFGTLLKEPVDDDGLMANGHFAPLWGVICKAMGLTLQQTAYVFLFNHVKAVLSAAVRASVMGPYQSQGILASADLQESIENCLEREWDTQVEDAGQVVPVMDLWVGRHELLYSRIFNS
ncbi:MAG: hypothetical protein M1827_000513 [Pycnora praestabilis]|nr:MAG: hypothetical protein M1827_000513 [Pycnora praestabilis]